MWPVISFIFVTYIFTGFYKTKSTGKALKKFTAVISVIIVVSAAWFYLRYHYENKTVNVWQLVHKNSLLVYDSERAPEAWNDFIALPAWKILSTIPAVDSLNLDLVYLDSITGHDGQIQNLLLDRNFLLSVNKVSNNRLDYVLFLSVNNNEKHRILNDIFNRIKATGNYTFDIRNFNNTDLYEIKNKNSHQVFTYFLHKNFFIGSFTPYLVEDVVRNVTSGYRLGFLQAYGSVLDFPTIKGDEGNLYFNPHELPSLITTFTDPSLDEAFKKISGFSGPGYFDINFEKNRFLMNGITIASGDTTPTYISTLADQTPGEISCFNLMPANTAYMFDYTFQNFSEWRLRTDRYWQDHNRQAINRKKALLNRYNIHETDFYNSIGNEISLAGFETGDLDNPEKIILIQSGDTTKIMDFMNTLTQTVNYAQADTMYYELYGSFKIRQLPVENFPSSLLGDLFSDFDNTYYTLYRNYLVLGNNMEAVENFLENQQDDNTWGKSVGFVQYFDNVQKKANFSLFVNLNRAYSTIYYLLDNKWKGVFKQYERQFRQFDILSLQFVNINHKIYSNIALQHKIPSTTIEKPSEFLADQLVPAESKLAEKPFVVKNHLDQSLEVLLQDTTGTLYQVSSDGKINWKKKFDHNIIGDVYQIDYYDNGKLQYLFNTGNSLQLIDRNGDNVEDFPLVFGDSLWVQWLNVVDYDNSKRYRFIISDQRGKLYLFDKQGKVLEGWNGLDMKGSLVQEPFHIRVRGRDCILAVGNEGMIHMLNRHGEEYPGFPYKFSSPLNGPVFVQPGPDFSRTLINVVTADGELIRLNLEGKIIDSKQLYKQGNSSYFQLIPSTSNDNYIISRQDYNKVSLLTRDGDPLFDKELLFSGRLKVQYYNFGVNSDIFALTDEQQEFTYLYDREGNLINNQPLESAYEVAILYSEANNRYKVYSCYGNEFRISMFYP